MFSSTHFQTGSRGRRHTPDDASGSQNQDEGVVHQALAGLGLIRHDSRQSLLTRTEGGAVVLARLEEAVERSTLVDETLGSAALALASWQTKETSRRSNMPFSRLPQSRGESGG